MVGGAIVRGEVARTREQILQPDQRTYAFVQRMLVANHTKLPALTGCELAVLTVESQYLRRNGIGRAAIVDDVVGTGEALLSGKLRCHDRSHRRRQKAASRDDAAHLQVLGTIDDKNALHTGQKTAALQQ